MIEQDAALVVASLLQADAQVSIICMAPAEYSNVEDAVRLSGHLILEVGRNLSIQLISQLLLLELSHVCLRGVRILFTDELVEVGRPDAQSLRQQINCHKARLQILMHLLSHLKHYFITILGHDKIFL